MKKLFVVICLAIVMAAGSAWAFTAGSAYNTQEMSQDLSVTNYSGPGMDSTITQDADGMGISVASPGGYGAEDQIQGQGIHEGGTNLTGNAYHRYDVDMMTSGGSATAGGIGLHTEAASVKGGITTQTDGVGTSTVAGSGMSTDTSSGSLALGITAAGTETGIGYSSEYIVVNSGPQSGQAQVGMQKATVTTKTGAAFIGAASAEATATQVGGGAMSNSGSAMGTMKSTAGAYTSVDTTASSVGIAGAQSHAEAMQVHEGWQGAVAGAGSYQYQHYRVQTGASETK